MKRHNSDNNNNNNNNIGSSSSNSNSSSSSSSSTAGWVKRKKKEGMKRPYCMRVYTACSPHMKVLEKLYLSPGRSLPVQDFVDLEKKCLYGLVARRLVDVIVANDTERKREREREKEVGHFIGKKFAITTPGVAHYIASRLGLSFAYTVYLAYLYVESRDPMYAFILSGGDGELAKMMVENKAEYPYGMLYSRRADKKFEGANMFVLGTFVKERGYCLNGLVPRIARYELSRKGIVHCVPGGTLTIPNERYKELQLRYDADLRAIVAWADRVCEMETAERMSEAAILGRALSEGGNNNSNKVESCESA